ncbi:MAG: flagellar biosynthesis anti-sigma factor FlgM [Gammaproteobacteria bacterium]|nr:flagellar biosynthesis anti-sigma factor FlgM [Gammaproteobacteria bacterium]
MATEINNISGSMVGNVGAGTGTQAGQGTAENKAAESQGNPASSRDTVSLTPQAQQLRDLESRIADLPEVDSNRVNTIRDAIANGSYEIDANRIAEKLMQFEGAL